MQNKRIDYLLQMLATEKPDAFLLYATAIEYESLQEFDKAAEYFEKLHLQFPDYLALYYQYGLFLHKQSQSERAISILTEGISLAESTKQHKTLNELRQALEWVEDEIE